jgi:hypothetical protein
MAQLEPRTLGQIILLLMAIGAGLLIRYFWKKPQKSSK